MSRALLVLMLLGIGFSLPAQDIGSRFGQNARRDTSRLNRGDRRIMGDTIKNKYSAKTTRFTYERNFKFNNIEFLNPDTIPDNLHRFTDLEQGNNFIQNLGNLGTAQRSLFYEPIEVIGRRSGYHAYDAFYTSPDKIRYFDTRSPYTDITAIFGGGGRAIADVLFTFNDSTQSNLGLDYNSIRADKQLAFLSRGDRNVESTDWNIFGFLRPKKLPRYLLLYNLTQMKHTVSEPGAIVEALTEPQSADSLFFEYRDEDVVLDDAESYDKRGGLHIYQQYDLDSAFQVYHSATYFNQILRYTDEYDLGGSDSLIYSNLGVSSAQIEDRTAFRTFSNEFGVKGRTKRFAYTLFYRLRSLRYDNVNLDIRKDSESYVGGTLRQQISPKIFLTASGEYLFGGNYLVKGNFTSSFFNVTYSRISSKPTYLSEFYKGQQRAWASSWNNEISDNLVGQININTQRLSFQPFVRFNRISNYQYYNEQRGPDQAGSDIVLLSPGFNFDYQLTSKWKWSSTAVYSSVSGGSADAFRIPTFMANGQIAHRNEIFDGKMIIQTGLDLHYRTGYNGLGYDPIVQQFYLQNSFENKAFIKMDLFLNFKVQNFIFFIKSAHFNQGLTSDGYFISPWITGTRQTFDMGVRWSFYD